ncbi:MAG TPA: M3 family metallopeptidase [Verrucomicrobiales bacterium]|nr:M3 family metallopeptidase [Verrucomicrobiales bacterium]
MASPHPFLDDSFLIRWSTLTPDHVVPDITKALEETTERLDAVCRTDRGRMTFESTFLAFEDALTPLNEAWGKVGHLDSVCNSPALRTAYNEMLPKVSEFFARLYLNESLWDLFKTFSGTPDAAKLTGVQRRYFEETMADFRASGADLPEGKKKRLEELEAELAQVTQKYSENVLDSTNAWELIIDDESKLAGLPETARAAARAEAKAKGIGTPETPAWRFTLKAPSFLPVMEYLDDEEVRRKVWEGSVAVGHSGEWDNTPLIKRALALRQEKAELLGKTNFADLVLERRMAQNGAKALAFVEDMHDRVAAAFSRQTRELQEYKAEALNERSGPLEPWETAYWSEKRRKAMYDFDEEELRPYFPIDGVIGGMFRLCEKLFGIEIRERVTAFVEPGGECPPDAVEVWHPEVKFYEIRNGKGVHLGSFYADWHPRDPKRGGAWMHYLKTGRPPGGELDREPHLGLICGNLTPSVDGKPALLSHNEVETIFHEFGHLLHHLLGQVEIKSLNGVNVAWDFVELPSQIMENFCWERKSLDFFARHYETGKPIPPKLFKKMIAAKNYLSAVSTMRQLAFGKMDLELHINHANNGDEDLDGLIDGILKGYLMPLKTKPPAIVRRFSHVFGGPVGYAAGYYSYLWAEVLDADCFSRFLREGVLNSKTGQSFRDCILAKGNSEPPEKLFRDFMGRDPDLNALLVRNGLA